MSAATKAVAAGGAIIPHRCSLIRYLKEEL